MTIFNGQPVPREPVRFNGQPVPTGIPAGVEFGGTTLSGNYQFTPSAPPAQEMVETDPTEALDLFFESEVIGDQSSFSYRRGTLLHATSDAALQDLTNNTRESEVYTTQDHDAGVYVRNPNRILPSVDLTGASPWNSQPNGEHRRAGTLITSKHIALAGHFNIVNGTTIRFVDLDGVMHDRILEDSEVIFGDLRVGTLDSDLPSSIQPFKVLPANWQDYIGSQFFTYNVIFATDQEERLLPKRAGSLLTSGSIPAIDHTLFPFSEYAETIIGGDSGNPIFFIINNWPVYVSQWLSPVSGTPIYPHYAEVEAYIGPEYSLDFIDLSNFKEF